jgi:MoxR-like ATPase
MKDKIEKIKDVLGTILGGKHEAVESALIAIFSRGHLLIEDLPGLGKTTLALGISKCLDLGFSRVQATTDLLPSDIIGVSIFNKDDNNFVFHKGPIFGNILLVDEINRATPKTQSALLEAMAERQVTSDGKTYRLQEPFFLIATANPVEQFGTFELPESQLDRFAIKMSLGYPLKDAEREILRGGQQVQKEIENLKPIIYKEEVVKIQNEIDSKVYVSDKVLDFIIDFANILRDDERFALPLSIRGTVSLTSIAKTIAYMDDRDYATVDDVKKVMIASIGHRVMLKEEYESSDKHEVLQSIMDTMEVKV